MYDILTLAAQVLVFAAAPIGFFLGRRKNKVMTEYKQALEDIMYLLEVERQYGELTKEMTGASLKNKVRLLAHASSSSQWSGRNTASQVAKKLQSAK